MMKIMHRYLVLLAVAVLGFSLPRIGLASPNVLVSIAPIQALVAELMAGSGTPKLLLGKDVDFHHFSYKPSDLVKLDQSELLIWVGNGLEPDLRGHIESGLVAGVHLQLTEVLEQALLLTNAVDQSKDEHSHDSGIDPHIWFSPNTMLAAMQMITLALQQIDPEHRALYQANWENLKFKLNALSNTLSTDFSAQQQVYYGVYHNAYRYFIRDAGLQAPLVFETSAHGQLSLKALRKAIKTSASLPSCVLVADLDPYKKISRVLASLNIKTIVTDGSSGGNYFAMMAALIADFNACLVK